jgi:ribosomal protein L37E
MNNYIECPRCGDEQRAEQTYCNNCGINMQKIFWEEKEKDIKEEKPKKGTFDKNFFRGKK